MKQGNENQTLATQPAATGNVTLSDDGKIARAQDWLFNNPDRDAADDLAIDLLSQIEVTEYCFGCGIAGVIGETIVVVRGAFCDVPVCLGCRNKA